MRRPLTPETEVCRGADDSLTEMMLPDSIHHHASSERMFRIGDPVRQLHSSAAVFVDRLPMAPSKDARKSTGDLFSRVLVIAALKDLRILETLEFRPDRATLLDRDGLWNLGRLFLLQRFELPLFFLEVDLYGLGQELVGVLCLDPEGTPK